MKIEDAKFISSIRKLAEYILADPTNKTTIMMNAKTIVTLCDVVQPETQIGVPMFHMPRVDTLQSCNHVDFSEALREQHNE